MIHYSKKPLKTVINPYTSYKNIQISQNQECKEYSRCNDFRTCPNCSEIHRKNIKAKLLTHLDEEIIESYQYKYFIRFRNNDKDFSSLITKQTFVTSPQEKNNALNFFMKDFTKSKRNDNFVIDENSEYFFNKEISFSKEYGYNPHTHMVILTNKEFDPNNKQFKKLLELNNIDYHIEDIYKRDNSYLKSLNAILHYINKFDEDTAKIQRETKILKGEHSNKHSKLFNINQIESNIIDLPFRQKLIYSKFFLLISYYFFILKHEMVQKLYSKIIEAHKQKIKEAKAIFKRNANKKNPHHYKILHNSFTKKVKFANSQRSRKLSRLKASESKF